MKRFHYFQFAMMIVTPPALAQEASFGVTGIASFETARLSAFCAEYLLRVPEPCEVEFEFGNPQGRQLKRSVISLTVGTGGFLDLTGSEAGSRGSSVEIVPCVRVLRGAVVVSLQTFDNLLLRTRLLTGWSDRPAARAGMLDFGAAGITRMDVARLSAFCPAAATRTSVAAESCNVEFIFLDPRGRVVKRAEMTLQPGTAGSLDLRSFELGTSGRVEIVPCVRVISGLAVANLRILDAATSQTNLLAYPGAALSAVAAQ